MQVCGVPKVRKQMNREGIAMARCTVGRLREVFESADAQRMPIRPDALRGSDSNRFYQRHGFVQTDEAEWDIFLCAPPELSDRFRKA